MQLTVPLILIALGGAIIVTQRDGWPALGGLAVQWIGLVWAAASLGLTPGERNATLAVEGVTALVCIVLIGVTLWSLAAPRRVSRIAPARASRSAKRSEHIVIIEEEPAPIPPQPVAPRRLLGTATGNVMDQVWLWAVVILGGVAGFGLAVAYPFGARGPDMLAFYWILLAGALALVIDGARSPVKLAVGLLALLNGITLIVYALALPAPGISATGLLALSRIGMAALLAYGLTLLKAEFPHFNIGTLFDSREGKSETEIALAVVDDGQHAVTPTGGKRPSADE